MASVTDVPQKRLGSGAQQQPNTVLSPCALALQRFVQRAVDFFFPLPFLLHQTLSELCFFSCDLELGATENPGLPVIPSGCTRPLPVPSNTVHRPVVRLVWFPFPFRIYTFVKLLGGRSDFWRKKHGIVHREAHPDKDCSS